MRDKDRLDRVRGLGCCVDNCGKQAVAAHSNFSIHGKARGIKADDKYTIPLCHKHHHQFDTYSMGLSRNESLKWFERKLKYVNEVLDGEKPKLYF